MCVRVCACVCVHCAGRWGDSQSGRAGRLSPAQPRSFAWWQEAVSAPQDCWPQWTSRGLPPSSRALPRTEPLPHASPPTWAAFLRAPGLAPSTFTMPAASRHLDSLAAPVVGWVMGMGLMVAGTVCTQAGSHSGMGGRKKGGRSVGVDEARLPGSVLGVREARRRAGRGRPLAESAHSSPHSYCRQQTEPRSACPTHWA